MLKKISKIYGGLKEHNIRNHKIEEYVLKEGLEKEIYKLVKEYLKNNQNEKSKNHLNIVFPTREILR